MTISRLNWGQINEPPPWSPVTGKLYALWPLPLDHDQCFQAAGVTDFKDSDDAWNHEFEALVQRLVDALGGAESATLKEGETSGILASVAQGREVQQIELKWEILV